MTPAALLLLAATSIVRMEVDTDTPAVDGTPAFVIGVDDVRRPVILVSPETYRDMVSQLERANKSDICRTVIHGKRVRTMFTTGHERLTVYEDGYTCTESVEPNKPLAIRRKTAHEAAEAIRERARKARAKRAEDRKRKAEADAVSEARKRAAAERRKETLNRIPPDRMSKRHRKFREELEKVQDREVTVIHDAVTGKDKVVE